MTTGLPMPSVAPSSTAAPTLAAPGAMQPAGSTDFLIMLSQLLGENVAAPPAVAPAVIEGLPTAAKAREDGEESGGDECAGLAALLAFLPVMPTEPKAIATGTQGDVRSEVAAILGQVAGRNAEGSLSNVDAKLLIEMADMPSSDAQLPTDVDVLPFNPGVDTANRAMPQPVDHVSRPIQTPVGNAAWAEEIGARLTLMAEQGRQSASLRLSPEHLGPLEVRIAVTDGGTSVWFGAAHADTRAAIEQALPRLREMFEAQGMSLTDAGVFREPPKDQQQQHSTASAVNDQTSNEERVATAIANVRLGLIDAYA